MNLFKTKLWFPDRINSLIEPRLSIILLIISELAFDSLLLNIFTLLFVYFPKKVYRIKNNKTLNSEILALRLTRPIIKLKPIKIEVMSVWRFSIKKFVFSMSVVRIVSKSLLFVLIWKL